MKKLAQPLHFNLVGTPEGLDDTVVLSITQEGMKKLAQLLLFNLVCGPEGLDDTVVLSITQEGIKSLGQPPLLDRLIAKRWALTTSTAQTKPS